jgi:hypothetical protein
MNFLHVSKIAQSTYSQGHELRSAHYIKVGARMRLYIRIPADVTGQQTFEIQLRERDISGIPTLDDAVRVATDIIEENRLCIDNAVL